MVSRLLSWSVKALTPYHINRSKMTSIAVIRTVTMSTNAIWENSNSCRLESSRFLKQNAPETKVYKWNISGNNWIYSKSYEFLGNFLGVFWEFMGTLWEFLGKFFGIHWVLLSCSNMAIFGQITYNCQFWPLPAISLTYLVLGYPPPPPPTKTTWFMDKIECSIHF